LKVNATGFVVLSTDGNSHFCFVREQHRELDFADSQHLLTWVEQQYPLRNNEAVVDMKTITNYVRQMIAEQNKEWIEAKEKDAAKWVLSL
jgi:hypothetical protein